MKDYKLLLSGYILRTADGAQIPAVTENIDYQNYLIWTEAGNVADPADAPVVPVVIPPSFDTLDIPAKALALTVASLLKIPEDQVATLYATKLAEVSAAAAASASAVANPAKVES